MQDVKDAKASLFSRAVSEQQSKSSKESVNTRKADSSSIPNSSHIVSGPWAQEIHKENVDRLKEMSTDEILSEKKNLEAMLDPSTLAFIKSMKNAKNKSKGEILDVCKKAASSSYEGMDIDENNGAGTSLKELPENKMDVDEKDITKDKEGSKEKPEFIQIDLDTEVKKGLPEPVVDFVKKAEQEGWVHMDDPEPEKVKWMEDLPENKDNMQSPEEPYNARFDFNGINNILFYFKKF